MNLYRHDSIIEINFTDIIHHAILAYRYVECLEQIQIPCVLADTYLHYSQYYCCSYNTSTITYVQYTDCTISMYGDRILNMWLQLLTVKGNIKMVYTEFQYPALMSVIFQQGFRPADMCECKVGQWCHKSLFYA